MSDDRVTRQVLAVILHYGSEQASLVRVWPTTKFVTVAHQGKVYVVKPTGKKDYPGFNGFEVWR